MLELIPILMSPGFAVLGLIQFIKTKRLFKVDQDILVLGGFYILVFASYILFEVFAVNYRPLLSGGKVETSYPSSTTLLVLCVISAAAMQFNERTQNPHLKSAVKISIAAFSAFMVIGRLASEFHWFTDIIDSVLFSASFVMVCISIKLEKAFSARARLNRTPLSLLSKKAIVCNPQIS
ncbi:MAG: phosphatase PAP2 family protein [Erysipelotrichia bacterium]|nr:phosphatase PAP2 family protein [Erysipelotrichia bacterium]